MYLHHRRLFKFLSKRYRAYQDTELEIAQALDVLESYGFRIETQLQLVQTHWECFGHQFQGTQARLLVTLETKLHNAMFELDRIVPAALRLNNAIPLLRPNKLRYSLQVQAALRNAIDEVKQWVSIFDPSWFLVARNFEMMQHVRRTLESKTETRRASALRSITMQAEATTLDTEQNNSHVFLPAKTLTLGSVPMSKAQHVAGLIVDTRWYEPSYDPDLATNDVRAVARALRKVDPSISGLLQCKGVIRSRVADQGMKFDFIFRVPQGLSEPRGLRDILLEAPQHPLNERVSLAKSLARSVAFVHNIQFVHKNISPETCIMFRKDESTVGTPFLVGFDSFRLAEGHTVRTGDNNWAKNLYRHPTRQGISPENRYIMQHDVYSLGVLLLEIGLWASFVTEHGEPSTALSELEKLETTSKYVKAAQTKAILIQLTNDLPAKVGTKYRDVVMACLTCLDEEDNLFGAEDEFLDEDGITVGVRYIEKVRARPSLSPDGVRS